MPPGSHQGECSRAKRRRVSSCDVTGGNNDWSHAIASAGDAYKAGTAAYAEKRYDEALAAYQKAFAAQPKEPAYAYAVGTAFHAKQDYDNALKWYQSAAEILKGQTKPDPVLVKDIPAAMEKAMGDKAEPIAKAAVEKQTAGDLAGGEFQHFQCAAEGDDAGGASLGHALLGTPPDLVDYFGRRVWGDSSPPITDYEYVPMQQPTRPDAAKQ